LWRCFGLSQVSSLSLFIEIVVNSEVQQLPDYLLIRVFEPKRPFFLAFGQPSSDKDAHFARYW
jgi:hypothetical protein